MDKILHVGLDVGNANTSVTVRSGTSRKLQIHPQEEDHKTEVYPTVVFTNTDGDELSAKQVRCMHGR